MGSFRTVGLGVSVALLLACGGVANARGEVASPARGADADKLDAGLSMLAAAADAGTPVNGVTGVDGQPTATGLVSGARVEHGRVLVDVHVDGSVADAAESLRDRGLDVTATSDVDPQRLVSGWVDVGRLDAVTALGSVRAVTAVHARTDAEGGTDAGSVLSQGDAAHHGPQARALGTTGAGVPVGVISDSINQVGGKVAGSQSTGDLPAGVTVLQDDTTNVVDEGRAMAEIIYDGAPGITQIYFATGTLSAASKASNIAALVSQGVKVIADDIFYVDEPMFQDGVVSQAVDAAKAAGVTYLASAGNRARQSWEGVYTPTTDPRAVSPSSNDFDPGAGADPIQTIGTFTNRTPFISIQWAEPWTGATTDLAVDGYIDGVYAGTVDTNNLVSGLPIEFVSFNVVGTHSIGFAIRRTSGSATPLIKYIVGGTPTFTVAEHATNSNAINPDAASAAGSLAVAASNWATPTTPEIYSSRGPAITRRFAANGTPLATPDVRPKPALTGADAVSTTVPGFQPFTGTSAATPSAAAVAALVRSAKPSLTVDQVASILTNPANALDCPQAAGQPDLDCGAGFLLADKAVAQALDASPPAIGATTSPAGPNGKDGWFTSPVTVSWSVTDAESPVLSSSGCGPVALSTDGSRTLTCGATTWGGSSSGSITVKLDRTKPVKLRFKGIQKSYAHGALPVKSQVKCKAKDPTSKIKSCTIKGFKTTKGTHKLKATAVNGAGLKTKATFTYTIS